MASLSLWTGVCGAPSLFLVPPIATVYQGAVLSIERTKWVFYNRTYAKDVIVTAKKYNRTNKLRFVTIKFDLLVPIDNTVMCNFYLYELLSNVYKRSFVEFHIAACDVLTKDNLVGAMLKEAYFRMPAELRPMKLFVCPLPPVSNF
ncbi:unnamed protein product [Euphydryas editha]|uniref:Uncharacterized protein n=1 Tax=Euphydryas editha TaxID=104508 RepID=A0AAU9U6E9_EUPED|nr:unnamed protein product [Euphydryas editha]